MVKSLQEGIFLTSIVQAIFTLRGKMGEVFPIASTHFAEVLWVIENSRKIYYS